MQKSDREADEGQEPSRLGDSNATGSKSNSNLGQMRAQSNYAINGKARTVNIKRKDSGVSGNKSQAKSSK